MFTCHVSGESTKTFKMSAEIFLKEKPNKKTVMVFELRNKGGDFNVGDCQTDAGETSETQSHAITTYQPFTGEAGIL